ncbi:protein LURP-one-related 8-like protein [Carex littledalei]|uniref:Protein LURP-one-related 8-like protein n=1 Tax=Carex littledalei TaxID=544730 RepID=A0A833W2P0_9POAL|nr:protein LURP-one-related 8-like protein [Carex littledalei]
MTKVYPNLNQDIIQSEEFNCGKGGGETEVVLTVWRKSLLFNGHGFTVFDPKGNLLFRVDNYASESRGEIVLMDANGKPLLTIKRKRLSLSEHWLVYTGECTTGQPLFSARKNIAPLHKKHLLEITTTGHASRLHVEGSYTRRCCSILDDTCQEVAAVKCKELPSGSGAAFGRDVFRLVVEPGFDPARAMAIVILLDQIFKR